MRKLILIAAVVLSSCSSQKYFIVRHAEKETAVMAGDPPLSKEGVLQALDIEVQLHNQQIRNIYATNYKRTIATAQPLADRLGLKVNTYMAGREKQFIDSIRNFRSGNFLIVGHSNTVNDLVNGLTGSQLMNDLPDTVYEMIYMVERKGKHYTFRKVPVVRRTPRN